MINILISIKPEHCCNILNRDKILEIRTTCPAEWKKYLDGKTNIKPKPCKVYIYCTKGKHDNWLRKYPFSIKESFYQLCDDNFNCLNGKVVAEFILNEIDKIERDLNDWLPKNRYETTAQQLKNSCLTEQKLWGYGKGKTLYAWHIDNLIIYDKPKELSEFKVYDKTYDSVGAFGWTFDEKEKYFPLKRPPQSWCYVEGIGEQV